MQGIIISPTDGVLSVTLRGRKARRDERVVTENADVSSQFALSHRVFLTKPGFCRRRHTPFFERNTPQDERALAALLRETLIRINRSLSDPAFNYIIHSNPIDEKGSDYYHWHMEIIPKLIRVGGFEWGSGSYINPVTPEHSAQSLRQALP